MVTKDELAEAQKNNFDFLMNFNESKTVNGVSIIKALAYDLIQILNDIYVKQQISESEE